MGSDPRSAESGALVSADVRGVARREQRWCATRTKGSSRRGSCSRASHATSAPNNPVPIPSLDDLWPATRTCWRGYRASRRHKARGQQTLERWEPKLTRVSFRPSALNLASYLAFRSRDVRPIQDELAVWGLSSLGRSESHLLANLDAVLNSLASSPIASRDRLERSDGDSAPFAGDELDDLLPRVAAFAETENLDRSCRQSLRSR